MSSMRDVVSQKLEKIEKTHQSLKTKRFGFLVRPIVLAMGWSMLILGLITVPFPGPGWLTVFIGIGILSLELHWAHRLLDWATEKYEQFFTWYRGRNKKTRYGLIFCALAAVWCTVGATTFFAWQQGSLPVLDPVIQAVIN